MQNILKFVYTRDLEKDPGNAYCERHTDEFEKNNLVKNKFTF